MKVILAINHESLENYISQLHDINIVQVLRTKKYIINECIEKKPDLLIIANTLPGQEDFKEIINKISSTKQLDIRIIYLYGEDDDKRKVFVNYLISRGIYDYWVGDIYANIINDLIFKPRSRNDVKKDIIVNDKSLEGEIEQTTSENLDTNKKQVPKKGFLKSILSKFKRNSDNESASFNNWNNTDNIDIVEELYKKHIRKQIEEELKDNKEKADNKNNIIVSEDSAEKTNKVEIMDSSNIFDEVILSDERLGNKPNNQIIPEINNNHSEKLEIQPEDNLNNSIIERIPEDRKEIITNDDINPKSSIANKNSEKINFIEIEVIDNAVISIISNTPSGKSTLAWILASCFAERNYKTSLINLDEKNKKTKFGEDQYYSDTVNKLIDSSDYTGALSLNFKDNLNIITPSRSNFSTIFEKARQKKDIVIIDCSTCYDRALIESFKYSNRIIWVLDNNYNHFDSNKQFFSKLYDHDYVNIERTIAVINNSFPDSKAFKRILNELNTKYLDLKDIVTVNSFGPIVNDLEYSKITPYDKSKQCKDDIDILLKVLKSKEPRKYKISYRAIKNIKSNVEIFNQACIETVEFFKCNKYVFFLIFLVALAIFIYRNPSFIKDILNNF